MRSPHPKSVPAPPAATRSISVVIPTRDRPRALAACLRALAAQDADSLEIVVVDDGSVDPAPVAGLVAATPRARLIRARPRGPAAARNLGAREAAGRVICFTDDDCEPAPAWARLLAERLDGTSSEGAASANPGSLAVAGLTLDGVGTLASAASQALTNALVAASLDPASGWLGFAPTCNLACSRALARELRFDEGYRDAAGEDRDWCRRARDRGVILAFEPAAIVFHNQVFGLSGFARQQIRYGRASVRFRARSGAEPRIGRLVAELGRAALSGGPRIATLVAISQALVRLGAASELARRNGAAPRRGAPEQARPLPRIAVHEGPAHQRRWHRRRGAARDPA